MAGKTLNFRAPGVYERETDQTQAGEEELGTGGCVIGTSEKGPAFYPVGLGSFSEFVEMFGDLKTDVDMWGAYCIRQFFKNAPSAVFVRCLGSGYDVRADDGTVPGAGLTLPSAADGGGMWFLGAIHSSSAGYIVECNLSSSGNSYDSDDNLDDSLAALDYGGGALIKAAIIAKSGVRPLLKESAGTMFVTGTYSSDQFIMSLEGFSSEDEDIYPSTITASFDKSKVDYFGDVFNTDLTKINDYGYALYADFGNADLGTEDKPYEVTSSEVVAPGADCENEIVFCMSGTDGRFNNFVDRYTTPISPFIVSQPIGVGSPPESVSQKLFRIEAISDGAWANEKIKVSIENIRKAVDSDEYGTFTLTVRDFYDYDDNQTILEKFSGLTLDPDDKNYICKRIGDKTISYDHDQDEGDRRLVVDGDYDNVSKYIRVVPETNLTDKNIPVEALPWGFNGYYLLDTSGSFNVDGIPNTGTSGMGWTTTYTPSRVMGSALIPPIPFRRELSKYAGNKKIANKKLYWGIQFERKTDTAEPNSSKLKEKIASYTKFFGNPRIDSPAVFLQDSNPDYWENEFSLARVAVLTKSNGDPDMTKIKSWEYKRDRTSPTRGYRIPDGSRSFAPSTDLNKATDVAKFSFFVQYGWDGLDFTDKNVLRMNNIAAYEAASNDGVNSNIVGSYRQALDIVNDPDLIDINILTVPGIREPLVTDYLIDVCEDRFDCIGIMDVEQKDSSDNYVLSSSQRVSVNETIDQFSARALDSNFAAAYFPDVTLYDDVNERNVSDVPPSIAAMGAYALNDKISHPWLAPAGHTRGVLQNVVDVDVKLNETNKNELYEAKINPIVSFPNSGPVIWGQKTLAAAQSALDRVNVRRMLLDVRSVIREIARHLVFEPSFQSTWNKFVRQATPALQRVKTQAGIERFKIIMDSTTTTEEDKNNNIMRGIIYLKPTYAAEFIDLKFVISNNSADFE